MKLILLAFCLIGVIFSAAGQACPRYFPSKNPIDLQLNKGLEAEPTSSPKIIIRCGRTINSEAKPLVVINGIIADEADIHSLNPADIKEIHVLKDAAATGILSCGIAKPVILIITKTQHRSFITKDAANFVSIPAATIRAELLHSNKPVYFIADGLGRIETDSLRSLDYWFTVSAPGYQTKTLGLKQIQKNKGEIFLETARTVQPSVQIETSVRLYPNPVVTGGQINISFQNARIGTYHIRVFNAAGHLIDYVQKPMAKAETERMQLGQTIAPGMYIVQVSDEMNHVVQTTKLLVK